MGTPLVHSWTMWSFDKHSVNILCRRFASSTTSTGTPLMNNRSVRIRQCGNGPRKRNGLFGSVLVTVHVNCRVFDINQLLSEPSVNLSIRLFVGPIPDDGPEGKNVASLLSTINEACSFNPYRKPETRDSERSLRNCSIFYCI